MCELLAMSASFDTELKNSLAAFQPRGGQTRPHADGWGIAIYSAGSGDPALVKEPEPAASSALFGLVRRLDMKGRTIIAHIRKANPPATGLSYQNTHPFKRSALGRTWVFAHNGKLPGIEHVPLRHHRPIGSTDSEHAFYLILDALQEESDDDTGRLGDEQHFASVLERITTRINHYGEFNYLISDGTYVAAHAHTYLHILSRSCVPCGNLEQVTLVATHPLTDEERWTCLVPNTLTLLRAGSVVHQVRTAGPASVQAWEAQERLNASV
ncbi:MAG: class II glutamine amidotransferase [Ottowia sp.]|nr:class II glutamine amidotransferase [Ottowia sp.]